MIPAVFFAFIGLPILAWTTGAAFLFSVGTHKRLGIAITTLLAPSVGFVVCTLPVSLYNRLGFPVDALSSSIFITSIFFVSATVLFLGLRKYKSSRLKAAFFYATLPIIGGLILSWPLFLYGYEWRSFLNGDYLFYSSGASRIITSGFYDIPLLPRIMDGSDLTYATWQLHVLGHHRAGIEHALAWACNLIGLNSGQTYMTLLTAFYIASLSSLGALLLSLGLPRPAPRVQFFIFIIIISASPLMLLSAYYQLLPQIAGAGALAGAIALLTKSHRFNGLFTFSIALAATVCGISLFYPEFFPFFLLCAFIWILVNFSCKSMLVMFISSVILGAATNIVSLDAIIHIYHQFGGQQKAVGFPYLLVPSGIPFAWGISSMGHMSSGWEMNALILLGGCMSLSWVYIAIISAKRTIYISSLSLAMFCYLVLLITRNGDFASFKMALFLTPLAWVTIVHFLLEFLFSPKKRRLTPGIIVAVIFLTIACAVPTSLHYMSISGGFRSGNGLAQAINPSYSHVTDEVSTLARSNEKTMLIGTDRLINQTILVHGPRGHISTGMSKSWPGPTDQYLSRPIFKVTEEQRELVNTSRRLFTSEMHPFFDWPAQGRIEANLPLFDGTCTYLSYNQLDNHPGFNIRKLDDLPLIFVGSRLGPHFLDTSTNAAFYLQEDDHFRNDYWRASSRRALFLVNPKLGTHLILGISDSLLKTLDTASERTISVYGDTTSSFKVTGWGSARIAIPLPKPQLCDGWPLIGIDFGVDPIQFPTKRSGLMKLYGTDKTLDPRHISQWIREITLSQAVTTTPSSISVPNDLRATHTFYSGIHEDGWASPAFSFTLSSSDLITLHFQTPNLPELIGQTARITIEQDDKLQTYDPRPIPAGDSVIRLRYDVASKNPIRVSCRFSKQTRLGAPDNRMIACQLLSISSLPLSPKQP